MDYFGLQARLRSLRSAESAALRRGDAEAAARCRERSFNLRHHWTSEQSRHISSLEEGKGNKDDDDAEWEDYDDEEWNEEVKNSEEGKDENSIEDNDEESSKQNEDESVAGCRQKKECPVPICDKEVVHLPRHLRHVHSWSSENARAATFRFKLRKKYTFTSEQMAHSGNRKVKKARLAEETNKKKPNRKRKLCPVQGCQMITDRLPQHLRKKHKLKQDDGKYRKLISLAKIMSGSRSHIFLRIKNERKKQQEERKKNREESQASSMSQDEDFGRGADNSQDADLVPVDTDESADDEANKATRGEAYESDGSSEDEDTGAATLAAEVLNQFQKWLVSPDGERKDTKTARQHVAQLKNILAIVVGAPISKPTIIKRLASEELDKTQFKDYTVAQIVSRLKYERKRKQSNKRLGDN